MNPTSAWVEYSYDGTPEGLFSALAVAIARNETPSRFTPQSSPQASLFGTGLAVVTDPAQVAEFANRLRARNAGSILEDILLAFATETADIEIDLLRYARLALTHGGDIGANVTDPAVRRVQGLARKAGRELHRLTGLLHFEELEDGLLWASCTPESDITGVLALHFARRMPGERWVICDVRRGTALYHTDGTLRPAELDPEALASLRQRAQLPGRTADSDPYARLWRTYFDTIAIRPRTNLRLQRQFMPKRFWQFLPEKTPR